MKTLRTQAVCVATALLLAACALRAQDVASKVDQYMQASVKLDHFMGSVLIAQHGKVLFSRGYGMANVRLGVPNTPQTEFRIGSNTKQFTAMAILELQERGKLSVQDPVCKYVPDCPKDWTSIKIFNLLTHTSGIPNFTSFPSYLKISAQPATPSSLLALFENKPLDFKPGEKFSYSNSGYVVLGYIIQNVSGETYQEFLQKNIFDPLGMKASGYGSSHPTGRNHAQGYVHSGNGFVTARYVDMTVPFSAGALYSTVLDLYKWDRSLYTNKLVSKKSLDEMFTPYVAATGEPGNGHYGFGWFISTEFGHKEIWHEGGISGFTSFNGRFPDDDASVIVLDNTTSPHIFAISHALAAILFGQKYEMPQERTAISVLPDVLQRYVGQYQLAPSFVLTVKREGPQLIAQSTGQPTAPIYPESKSEFFYKVVDAQISFVENSKGEVTGLVLHQNGRDLPAKRISSVASAAPPAPKVITLPAGILARYVGEYQLAPSFEITITREGDQLTEQATSQPAFPIFPESKNEFFLKVVDAQITFVEDPAGKVTGLILHQNGRDTPGTKVK